MNALTWFPLSVSEIQSDPRVMALTPEELGALLRLRCSHFIGGGLPADDALLAEITRCGGRWPEVRDTVLAFFEKRGDRYINPDWISEKRAQERIHKAKRDAGKRGGEQKARNRKAGADNEIDASTATSSPPSSLLPIEREIDREIERVTDPRNARDFVTYHAQLFQDTFSTPYVPNYSREGGEFKRLLKTLSPNQVKAKLDLFYTGGWWIGNWRGKKGERPRVEDFVKCVNEVVIRQSEYTSL